MVFCYQVSFLIVPHVVFSFCLLSCLSSYPFIIPFPPFTQSNCLTFQRSIRIWFFSHHSSRPVITNFLMSSVIWIIYPVPQRILSARSFFPVVRIGSTHHLICKGVLLPLWVPGGDTLACGEGRDPVPTKGQELYVYYNPSTPCTLQVHGRNF